MLWSSYCIGTKSIIDGRFDAREMGMVGLVEPEKGDYSPRFYDTMMLGWSATAESGMIVNEFWDDAALLC